MGPRPTFGHWLGGVGSGPWFPLFKRGALGESCGRADPRRIRIHGIQIDCEPVQINCCRWVWNQVLCPVEAIPGFPSGSMSSSGSENAHHDGDNLTISIVSSS